MGQNEKENTKFEVPVFEISSMECDKNKPLKFNDNTTYSKARKIPKKNDNLKEE
ncbi:MAG: hypothetical protein U0O41_06340 [Clostridia bacterium]|jgi:hypothetical protein|nr:MAG TPA: hypothetical protein [Caudoviricetes sp.]